MKNQTLQTFLMEKRDTTKFLMKKADMTNFSNQKRHYKLLYSMFTSACGLTLNMMKCHKM